jgi:hypothetical protein
MTDKGEMLHVEVSPSWLRHAVDTANIYHRDERNGKVIWMFKDFEVEEFKMPDGRVILMKRNYL